MIITKFVYVVKKGEIPKWYGLSYYIAERDAEIWYPIPINYIVRYARRTYWRFLHICYWIGIIDIVEGECFSWSAFYRIKMR